MRRRMRKRQKRPWVFILSLVVSVVLFVVQQLLVPKTDIENAKAAGLGDFNFPTSLENRSLPLSFGTGLIKAPNVIWYGDLRIKKLTDRVPAGGLFAGKETIVVGHTYFIGFDLAICMGPIDSISQVKVADRVLLKDGVELPVGGITDTGNARGISLLVDKPEFLGGHKSGGGFQGAAVFYNGNLTADANAYVVSKVDPTNNTHVPGYPGMAHMVWAGGTVGEQSSISKWEFRVHRYPNGLGVTGDKHKIGITDDGYADANPVCCLYEILTDVDYGLGISPTNVVTEGTTGFLAYAAQLYDEGNGFSYVIDKALSAQTLVDEILKQIEGSLYQNKDGRFQLKLIRHDFVVGDLESFDASNILKVTSLAKQGWSETTNAVHVEYFDRRQEFKKTIAIAHDLGNIQINGGVQEVGKFNYPGVRLKEQAAYIAARELRDLSTPLVRMSFKTNRDASDLYPGDVVKVTFPEYSLNEMVLRVSEVGLGDLVNGDVTIKGYQDIFGETPDIVYVGGGENLHENINMDAIPAVNELIMGVPAWVHWWYGNTRGNDDIEGTPDTRWMHLCAAPDKSNVSFQAKARVDGEYTSSSIISDTTTTYVPTAMAASLQTRESDVYIANDGSGGPVITFDPIYLSNAFTSQTEDQIRNSGYGLFMIGNEIMAFESIKTIAIPAPLIEGGTTAILGVLTPDDELVPVTVAATGVFKVHRGLLDTDITDHGPTDRVWFLTSQDPCLDSWDQNATTTLGYEGYVKHITRTPVSTLPVADAVVVAPTGAPFGQLVRTSRPLRPANLSINTLVGAASHGSDIGVASMTVKFYNQNTGRYPDAPEVFLQDTYVAHLSIDDSGVAVLVFEMEDHSTPGLWTYIDCSAQVGNTANGLYIYNASNVIADGGASGPAGASGQPPRVEIRCTNPATDVGGTSSFNLNRSTIVAHETWVAPFTNKRNIRVTVTRYPYANTGGYDGAEFSKPSLTAPYRVTIVDGN